MKKIPKMNATSKSEEDLKNEDHLQPENHLKMDTCNIEGYIVHYLKWLLTLIATAQLNTNQKCDQLPKPEREFYAKEEM